MQIVDCRLQIEGRARRHLFPLLGERVRVRGRRRNQALPPARTVRPDFRIRDVRAIRGFPNPLPSPSGYAAGTTLTTGPSYSYYREFPQLVQRYVSACCGNFRLCRIGRSVQLAVPAAYGGSDPVLVRKPCPAPCSLLPISFSCFRPFVFSWLIPFHLAIGMVAAP